MMWRDPMDELIADLEEIAPPEQPNFYDREAMVEVHYWAARIVRRGEDAYPDPVDQDDPEVQREAENMGRAMNRALGRPEDWTPGS